MTRSQLLLPRDRREIEPPFECHVQPEEAECYQCSAGEHAGVGKFACVI
jgi:hypothetical protein